MKTERIFTLSEYDKGQHRIKGYMKDDEYVSVRASFAESLSPLSGMIAYFKTTPLGTKIKVTMETIKD